MSKPGKSLKGLCKKLGVRLTVKRGKKRVYKSVKVLKAQCARKKKVKRKIKRRRKFGKKKRKRRRRKFGSGTRPDDSPLRSDNAPDPVEELYGDVQDDLIFHSPGWSPSPGLSPIMLPPSVRPNLGARRLFFEYGKRKRRFGSGGLGPNWQPLYTKGEPIGLFVEKEYEEYNKSKTKSYKPRRGMFPSQPVDDSSDGQYQTLFTGDFGKKSKKKSLRNICKKLGVRLTVKRGQKRVYKSVKVLKTQCKRKAGKKKKKIRS